LKKIENYIKFINRDYNKISGPTYYNYSKMLEKISQKRINININPKFYKKLKTYLFNFCELDQPAIDSIAVF
jgi:hypothetical protein